MTTDKAINTILKQHAISAATVIAKLAMNELRELKFQPTIKSKFKYEYGSVTFLISVIVDQIKYSIKFNGDRFDFLDCKIKENLQFSNPLNIGLFGKQIPKYIKQIEEQKIKDKEAKELQDKQMSMLETQLVVKRTYTLTKAVQKVVQKAIDKGGYSEFESLIKGEESLQDYVNFLRNMSSCDEPESASEFKIKEIYDNAVSDLNEHLFKSNQISKEVYDEVTSY